MISFPPFKVVNTASKSSFSTAWRSVSIDDRSASKVARSSASPKPIATQLRVCRNSACLRPSSASSLTSSAAANSSKCSSSRHMIVSNAWTFITICTAAEFGASNAFARARTSTSLRIDASCSSSNSIDPSALGPVGGAWGTIVFTMCAISFATSYNAVILSEWSSSVCCDFKISMRDNIAWRVSSSLARALRRFMSKSALKANMLTIALLVASLTSCL